MNATKRGVGVTPAPQADRSVKKRARAPEPKPQAETRRIPKPVPRNDVPSGGSYRLEPHICRVCHSRIGSFAGVFGGRVYQCTNCGLEAPGDKPACICCCGFKLRKPGKTGRTGAAEVDAGIRCIANPNPTPEFPSLFVAGTVDIP